MSIESNVTNMVIKGLEDGVAPWIRGWSDDGTKNSLCLAPRNGYSQRPYTGINSVSYTHLTLPTKRIV